MGMPMNRKKTLQSIIQYRREWSSGFQKYLNTPREYYPGEKMYMREVHVVMEIGESGIDNVSELSERLEITKGAVSQYLNKLEKKGFIERIQDTEDKRQFSVQLTEKGRMLCNYHREFDDAQYGRAAEFFSKFSDDELETALKIEKEFKKFVQIMQNEPEEGAYGNTGKEKSGKKEIV